MFSPQASPCPRFWTCVNSLSPSVRPLLLPSQKFVTISVWGRLHLHVGSPTTSAYWSDFYKGLEVLHALWWPWPVFTFARLHHQEPVWLLPIIFSPQIAHHQFVCLFSPGDPPNQVFRRETVTMRAQVRHRYAPLPLRWRDDASQVICASRHDFLDGGQLSCLILCQLLESFLYFVKGPFRYFHFIPESVFILFPQFCACSQCRCSISLAPSTLWLAKQAATDPAACFSSPASSRNIFTLALLVKNIPTFLVRVVLL